MLVTRDGNTIRLRSLTHPGVASNLIAKIREGRSRGYDDFVVDLRDVESIFPNACVPVAGLLGYFAEIEELEFAFVDDRKISALLSLQSPPNAEDDLKIARSSPLNRVWRYHDVEAINALVSGFRDEVERAAVCEKGVIEGLEWSLNEVMDNVLQHAGADCGFVMGQVHEKSKHIALCVFDFGQGILNSFDNTPYTPNTAGDAITLALREGVTRNKKTNQGNGLWGLNNIVNANSGMLAISSGRGHYVASAGAIRVANMLRFPTYKNACTTVDFQIDFDKPISVPNALGGHEPTNLRLEEFEDGDGNVQVRVADWTLGTGTRKSGLAIRNQTLNLFKKSSARLVIDFSGVGVIASSFADEFLGRLVTEMGVAGFMSRIELRGMNGTVQAIANRSIAQRIAQASSDAEQ